VSLFLFRLDWKHRRCLQRPVALTTVAFDLYDIDEVHAVSREETLFIMRWVFTMLLFVGVPNRLLCAESITVESIGSFPSLVTKQWTMRKSIKLSRRSDTTQFSLLAQPITLSVVDWVTVLQVYIAEDKEKTGSVGLETVVNGLATHATLLDYVASVPEQSQ
jgi:hypothetical protein